MGVRSILPAAVLVLLSLPACDKASPVAPTGTVLTIAANPNRISSTGTSQIIATALRPNGTPVNPGTEVTFTTDLGTIEAIATTDARGTAEATLRGTGQTGTATVTARSGGAEPATVEVTVGIQAGQLRLQATPTTIPEDGGDIELLVIVWDDQGDLLPGAQVIFSSEVGVLESGGSVVQTDSGGEVRDLLQVSAQDVNVVSGDTFEAVAESPTAGGIISDSVTLFISRPPRANFTFAVSGLTVTFTDTSTGSPTSWRWDFGDGGTSAVRNPSHIYGQAGTYVVELEARNAAGSDIITRSITLVGSG